MLEIFNRQAKVSADVLSRAQDSRGVPRLTYLEEAKVEVAICPQRRGRVKFQGSWWPAQCEQNVVLHRGTIVRVLGIENITLLVEPLSSSE